MPAIMAVVLVVITTGVAVVVAKLEGRIALAADKESAQPKKL